MRLKNTIPKYAIPQGKPRSWLIQTNASGILCCHHTLRKSHALAWPAGSILTANSELPCISNRRFRAFLFSAWLHILNATDRGTWAALALLYHPTNFHGVQKQYAPYNFFVWYHVRYSYLFYTTGKTFIPNPSLIVHQPPTLLVASSLSSGPVITKTAPDTLTVVATYNARIPAIMGTLMISNPKRNPTGTFTGHFSTVNNCPATYNPTTFKTTITANFRNIIEVPPRPGIRQIRIAPIWAPALGDYMYWYPALFALA